MRKEMFEVQQSMFNVDAEYHPCVYLFDWHVVLTPHDLGSFSEYSQVVDNEFTI